MISGGHVVIYTRDADADRAFFRDVLKLPHADAGGGWLIFAVPQAEVAMHPASQGGDHELFLTCDDVHALIEQLRPRGIVCSDIHRECWGALTRVTLPSGGQLGIYQPSHAQPRAR